NLGVNYETRGRSDLAILAYRIALGYAPRPTDLQLYASIATRLAYCLLQTRPRAASLAYLRDAAQQARGGDEAAVLRWVADQLARDPAQFAALAIPRLGG
ncbi:MAG TPA: hypothetical protein VGU27_09050, partial [Candidatus Eisenbacteria bacterium]|nr:hypothetical protein [Candidatus Eisenbacteria bacterium]